MAKRIAKYKREINSAIAKARKQKIIREAVARGTYDRREELRKKAKVLPMATTKKAYTVGSAITGMLFGRKATSQTSQRPVGRPKQLYSLRINPITGRPQRMPALMYYRLKNLAKKRQRLVLEQRQRQYEEAQRQRMAQLQAQQAAQNSQSIRYRTNYNAAMRRGIV